MKGGSDSSHPARGRMLAQFNRFVVVACWFAGAGLILLNFRLAEQNRELVAQVDGFYRSISLPEGAQVPALVGTDRQDREVILDPASEERPALVLVFSPFCPACDDNWPRWQPLIETQRFTGGRIVPVDITGAVSEEYLAAHGIDSVPIVSDVTAETNMAYRFRFTPQTLILDKGRVVAGWTGVLTEEDVSRAVLTLGGSPDDLDFGPGRAVHLRPACDGLTCNVDGDCGSRCTCERFPADSLGTCVAKPGA